MRYIQIGNDVVIDEYDCFDLAQTLDCGQAFRWRECDGEWRAVVGQRLCRLRQADGKITFYDCDLRLFEDFYIPYFDLNRDYGAIIKTISADETLRRAASCAGGIRILRQDLWETVCSFIISQNNNIPRIKVIIERLCENFGNPCGDCFTFPTADKIASLSPDDLAVIRSGFRAKYILDAAKRLASGELSEEKLAALSTDEARLELMKIYGVGEKVADCVLLFSLARIDALPKDVWIKRALKELFDGALPECAMPYAGIAQQYIFHFMRTEGAGN